MRKSERQVARRRTVRRCRGTSRRRRRTPSRPGEDRGPCPRPVRRERISGRGRFAGPWRRAGKTGVELEGPAIAEGLPGREHLHRAVHGFVPRAEIRVFAGLIERGGEALALAEGRGGEGAVGGGGRAAGDGVLDVVLVRPGNGGAGMPLDRLGLALKDPDLGGQGMRGAGAGGGGRPRQGQRGDTEETDAIHLRLPPYASSGRAATPAAPALSRTSSGTA